MTETTPNDLIDLEVSKDTWPKSMLAWIFLGIVSIILFAIRSDFGWIVSFPEKWVLPFAEWINLFMNWFIDANKAAFRFFAKVLTFPMDALRTSLIWLPWPAVLIAFCATAHSAGGWRLMIFTLSAFGYILVFGYWVPTMATLALVFLSVPLSVLIGLFIGVATFASHRTERLVMPMLDVMQTFPTFAYLIPILFLMGFGPVVGLVASAIYAMPPMVRNVVLGLRRVAPEVVESGVMSGATPLQLLWTVRLPAAMPTIMIGINQSTMAAFSMIIIASVIGGSADIGWEVLSAMRKAAFGQSFLAGIVIALMAMVMDRISRGFALRHTLAHNGPESFITRNQLIISVLCLMIVFIVLAQFFQSLKEFPEVWVINPARYLNDAVDYVISEYSGILDAIKNSFLIYFLLPIRLGLENSVKPFTWGFELNNTFIAYYLTLCIAVAASLWRLWGWHAVVGIVIIAVFYYYGTTGLPWPLFIAFVTLLAFQVAGFNLAVFAFLGLIFMLLSGFWPQVMRSVYLCGAAVFFAFSLGFLFGICAAMNDRFSVFIRPINDTLQTMPLFVFLIPVIMFFQIGDFPAMLAIIMYAIVPAIRYTEHGIRNINPSTLEAAEAQGCTKIQKLFHVQLPLALPEIMLGLNQTIIFSLAMLVIAALVGTKGLGQSVYVALSSGNVGNGIIAGLSIAIIAMIADKIIQAWANKKKKELGLI
ncbi:MAG: ABC transporter permease subunit [Rhodospirillales bacterium]|nr:ABC transporter permease subunit [Rhodospirillales bacterium]